jgi:hypothetical protein
MDFHRHRMLTVSCAALACFAGATPRPAPSADVAVGDARVVVDVVVVGATPAGVAAAVAAARSGASVVVLEESAHVGGVVAGGLTNTDIRKHGAVGGLYNEFKRRIVEHYVASHGADSPEVQLCRNGNMFSPRVAERVFREMLGGERRIRLLERRRVVAARVTDQQGVERPATRGRRIDGADPGALGPPTMLVGITAADLASSDATIDLQAKCFVDCTYEGDLAALAGAAYRVGRESRTAFREPHAGNIYVRFRDVNPLPGSTGAADDGIQAFCFRFHLTKDRSKQVPVEKPAGFDRDDYRHLLGQIATGRVTSFSQVIQLYPMPGGNHEVNSDHPHPGTGAPAESLDLAEENWRWPEAGPEERRRIFDRYWSHNEGLLWLLQHDPAVPVRIREEAGQWGFPRDEFTDHRHRPHQIYVRQGRRIWGEYTLTENDAVPEHATGLPKRQPDGIAVTEFEFDSHAVTKFDPAHPGVREGYFFISHDPFQLPYRIMLPRHVDGLLVPVACSTTHVGYQTLRMEPVFMALGEAAGIAGAFAAATNTEPRRLDVTAVQREIIRRGGVILYENAPLVPEALR